MKTISQKLSLVTRAIGAIPGTEPMAVLGLIDGQFQAVAQDRNSSFEVRVAGTTFGDDAERVAEELLRGTLKKVGPVVSTIGGTRGEKARAELRGVEAELAG